MRYLDTHIRFLLLVLYYPDRHIRTYITYPYHCIPDWFSVLKYLYLFLIKNLLFIDIYIFVAERIFGRVYIQRNDRAVALQYLLVGEIFE